MEDLGTVQGGLVALCGPFEDSMDFRHETDEVATLSVIEALNLVPLSTRAAEAAADIDSKEGIEGGIAARALQDHVEMIINFHQGRAWWHPSNT